MQEESLVTEETSEVYGLKLLLDVPETEVAFRFDVYAKVIARGILSSEPRLTIGIFGPWGKGKTTLLDTIAAELERERKKRRSRKSMVIRFDAWRYQNEAHMAVPMLETLQMFLEGKEGSLARLRDTVAKCSKAIAYSVKVGGGPLPLTLDLGAGARTLEEGDAKTLRTDYHLCKALLSEALSAARRGSPGTRIVFMIDDLDRCAPGKSIEVLEAIKAMMDVPGFVFVLALDKDVIGAAVESHYKDYGIRGEDYIKKIVQVEFSLPPLRQEDIQSYVKLLQDRLGGVRKVLTNVLNEVIPELAGDNPREVKRFINNALITDAIVTETEAKVPVEAQVAFLAIRVKWPWLAEVLSKQPGLLESEDPQDADQLEAARARDPQLDAFLDSPVGVNFLGLSKPDLERLIFFTALVETPSTSQYEPPTPERIPSEPKDLDTMVSAVFQKAPFNGPRGYQLVQTPNHESVDMFMRLDGAWSTVTVLKGQANERTIRVLSKAVKKLGFRNAFLVTSEPSADRLRTYAQQNNIVIWDSVRSEKALRERLANLRLDSG